MSSQGLKIVWGAAGVRSDSAYGTQEQFDQIAKVLKAGGCDTLDTATLYGESEKLLSEFGANKEFTIDTKAVGGFNEKGTSDKETIIANGEASQKFFGKHLETLEGVNEIYKRGFFKRFGLSNFKVEDVQKAYDICKAKGYPLPSVYQGNYNPVARLQEDDLFPLLRKLNMSFYVYSPLAGGFLTKTKQDIQDGKGRFDPSNYIGEMYSGLYARPTLLESLAEWESIAKEEGIPRAELAYRWVNYNSPLNAKYGDAIIFGASSVQQAEQTLAGLKKGPLSDKAVKRIDAIWQNIKHEAPRDNLHK
ncbi:hypothetical protein AMS68_003713 [Peltaster fructicola]|uniref:NADP-dependent oxidoreductase domain-containing protein n=1 Tax=Peltaster fructicola TaxID=286661 RepID=A0A6H0XU39_9PEZI|nr:hypothetical protein AMS68_003713 [Peltaster fructicola]